MEGFKLPKGALDKEQIKDILSRLSELEKNVAELSARCTALGKQIASFEKALEKKK